MKALTPINVQHYSIMPGIDLSPSLKDNQNMGCSNYLRIYSTMAETKNVECVPISSMARKTLRSTSSGDIKGAGSPIRSPCNPKPDRDGLLDADDSTTLPLLPSPLRNLYTRIAILLDTNVYHTAT